MNSLREEKSMRVSVWDTYVRKRDGDVMHFDIIVPEHMTDSDKIFSYGNEYVATKGERKAIIDSKQCQFCHIEAIGEEMKDEILGKGYFIQDMQDIPGALPLN